MVVLSLKSNVQQTPAVTMLSNTISSHGNLVSYPRLKSYMMHVKREIPMKKFPASNTWLSVCRKTELNRVGVVSVIRVGQDGDVICLYVIRTVFMVTASLPICAIVMRDGRDRTVKTRFVIRNVNLVRGFA